MLRPTKASILFASLLLPSFGAAFEKGLPPANSLLRPNGFAIQDDASRPARHQLTRHQLTWRRTENSIALWNNGSVVWQFNYGKDHPKPCFHPLAAIDGTELTGFRPSDHRWHRAGWFSFKFINGVNYWEEDPKTGIAAGVTETVDVRADTRADFSATIDVTLSYHLRDSAELLAERRRIEVSAPDRDGNYTLDWQHLFTAREDLSLDRTPLPGQPGGKGHGGYAGLSLRLAKRTMAWSFLDAQGRAKGSHGLRAKWLAFAGPLADGKAGLTFFDHPSNRGFPTRWFTVPGMPYFSPAFIFDKPMSLEAGQHLSLFYRMKVYSSFPESSASHAGKTETATLNADFRSFANRRFELVDPSGTKDRVDLVALGQKLCMANCIACHSIVKEREDGKLGPTLYGLISRTQKRRDAVVRKNADSLELGRVESVLVDEAYIHAAIKRPSEHLAIRTTGAQAGEPYPPAMPPFLHFSSQDIQALIAFFRTLNEASVRGPSEVLVYEEARPSAEGDKFEILVKDRPLVYRVAMADVSARAISVGLPSGHNYIFDPSTFSVKRAWGGGFLNVKAERSGRGRGNNRPGLLGHRHLGFGECLLPLGASGPVNHDFRDYVNNSQWRRQRHPIEAKVAVPFIDRHAADDAKFGGYLLRGTEPPSFLFAINGVEYAQQLIFESDHLLHFHFTTKGAKHPLRFKVRKEILRDVHSTAGKLEGDILHIPASSAGDFTISVMLAPNKVPPASSQRGGKGQWQNHLKSARRRLGLTGKTNHARGAKAESPGTKDHAAIGPQGAIDGQAETYWDEVDSQGSYSLKLELAKPAEVSAALIVGYEHHNFAPKDFELIIDGTVVRRVTKAKYTDNVLLVRFPRIACSRLELKVTGYYGKSPAVRELELFDLKAGK